MKARRAAAVSRALKVLPSEKADLLTQALPALEAFAEAMRQEGLDDRLVSS